MDVNVYVIVLTNGLIVLIIAAVVLLRLVRTATPAHGLKFRNEARLSLWLAMITAGGLLLGGLKQASVNPQTVGWPTSWGLMIICVGLWVVGIIGSIRCLLRMRDIEAQIEAEGDDHSS